MTTRIYHGGWINWTDGAVLGATITVSSRDGTLLISFIATFVTIVGAQLWRILSYMIHQIRSSKDPQDGLHYQQQNILRNTASAGGAAWSFLEQAWYWHGKASMSILRTIPWTLFSVIYLILFALLATFSSEVSKSAGRTRLLRGGDCGIWVTDGDGTSDLAVQAYNQKMANESIVSSTYAKACYGSNPVKASCQTFPVPALQWTAEANATCPFDDRLCLLGENAAYKMTSEKIDTHIHLGINAPTKRRLQFTKETTCSPLAQQRQPKEGADAPGLGAAGDTLLDYFYGGIGSVTNHTYRYNTHSYLDNFGWVTLSLMSLAPHEYGNGWNPITELQTEKADVSIIFIAANSVRFLQMCDDPVFGAHYIDNGTAPKYATDEYVVPIACSEAYQICNPTTDECTPFVGSMQLINATQSLGLDIVQAGETNRLAMAALLTNMEVQTYTRRAGALRAEETTAALIQFPLPNNQWQIEAASWFETGLARLQHEIQSYATGPTNLVPGSRLLKPGDAVSATMCQAQMVKDDGSTTSFSILGLVLIFVVGGMIILTSWTLDTIVGWLQSRLKKGEYKKLNWLLDDKLKLQRMLLEGVGLGIWEGAMGFPTTMSRDRFGGWRDIDVRHPTLIPKSAGTNSPWAGSQEVIPNHEGKKSNEVFVREVQHS